MALRDLINRIDLLRNELAGLQPLPAERQDVLDKKFRLEFNYNSNHIEGNTLTYGETMLYLIFDKTTGEHEGREYEEMRASDAALKLIQEFAADKQRPLTESFIKNLNEIILVRPYWANAITPDGQNTRRKITVGDYKKQPNSVRLQNGEMFHYTSPQETPAKMGELVQWFREESEKKEIHPVVIAALLHYKFVIVHPFDDGNGRLSRLLMNYVLYYYGFPPVIIKSANKKDYLFALNKADSGDIDSFVTYVAEQMLWSLKLSIKAAKGENIDEPGDLEKKLSQLKKELGQEADNEIEIKNSTAAIKVVIEQTIIPFVRAWEEKLKNFDTLFFSRTFRVSFNSKMTQGVSAIETFDQANKDFFKAKPLNSHNNIEINEMRFSCLFRKLRALNTNGGYNGGEVKFIFHDNVYEIEFSGAQKKISKLYNQHLTATELEHIVSTMGNWLFSTIEKALEYNRS